MIINIRVDYTIADMEALEKLSAELNDLFNEFKNRFNVKEYIQISTCNRDEYYINTDLCFLDNRLLGRVNKDLIIEFGDSAIIHLLRMTSGLESMIIGEDQILGQVKNSLNQGKKEGHCGKVLETLFTKAIHVGQIVRTKTRINRGSVSIGSAAVDLARQHCDDLTHKCVLVIGAGKMGSLVAKALSAKNLKAILVANRTYHKAVELAKDLNGKAISFDELNNYISKSDLIISATGSPHLILTKERLEKYTCNERDSPVILIDLANPRDIAQDVVDLNVELFNIDDLREIANENKMKREKEADEAEKIILEEFRLLKNSFRVMDVEGLLFKIRMSMEDIRQNETQKAISKIHPSRDHEKIIDAFSKSIVNKIFHNISKNIKRSAENEDHEIIEVVKCIFDV
ncbi:MAG: glutamyl-tRNA reductase [Methanobrevibacter sp.]|jgi:glutamyl-tRNA reductase|nr:glutamyl-tRNA reductase [Candidatus Methanovirga aequatorialis]